MNIIYNEPSVLEDENGTDVLSHKVLAPLKPEIIEVTLEERKAINQVAEILGNAYKSYEDPEYISNLHIYAYQFLPDRLIRILSKFGTDFSASQFGAIVFRGIAYVDQDALGPTPARWQEADYSKLNKYGFISSLLHGVVPSKPVQYYSQRKGGGLMHPIIPDANMTYSQTGSGSKTDLYVHTEDAFLFNPADFLSFLYLRNEEMVPSTLYSIRSHGEVNEALKPLFLPIYRSPQDANYKADESNLVEVKTPVLYGNEKLPFIRFDAAEQIFNPDANQTPEAMNYLKNYWEEAGKLIYNEFVPESGDLIFVNNHLCAHGRNAFEAGVKVVNGKRIKCERRQMMRMMSKASLINIRHVTHTNDPYLVMEKHLGQMFEETKK